MSKFRHSLLLSMLALPTLAQAQSAGFEDIDRLEARVTAALDADIGQPGGIATSIDRRLKLARCPASAQIDPPALGAIALRCPQIGWRIRVPLAHLTTSAGAAEKIVPIVRKGDPVQFSVDTASFSVSTEAVAQEDGGIGDRIRIKTDPKAPIMIAEVVDSGRVRLPGYR